MIENDRLELFDRVGTVGVIAGDFVCKSATRRDFDSLKGGRETVQLFRQEFAEVYSRTVLCDCAFFSLCYFVCHNVYLSSKIIIFYFLQRGLYFSPLP